MYQNKTDHKLAAVVVAGIVILVVTMLIDTARGAYLSWKTNQVYEVCDQFEHYSDCPIL